MGQTPTKERKVPQEFGPAVGAKLQCQDISAGPPVSLGYTPAERQESQLKSPN